MKKVIEVTFITKGQSVEDIKASVSQLVAGDHVSIPASISITDVEYVTVVKTAVAGVVVDHVDAEGKVVSNTITKEESKMTQVKDKTVEKAVEMKDQAKDALNKAKEAGLVGSVKGAYTWMKDTVVMPALRFLGSKKVEIAIGSFSVTAAGLVTTGAVAAVAVGAVVASLAVLAAHLMLKKKEQSLSYKAMLSSMGVAVATTAVLPYLLYAAAIAGLYVTVYGAILPYLIIVA